MNKTKENAVLSVAAPRTADRPIITSTVTLLPYDYIITHFVKVKQICKGR